MAGEFARESRFAWLRMRQRSEAKRTVGRGVDRSVVAVPGFLPGDRLVENLNDNHLHAEVVEEQHEGHGGNGDHDLVSEYNVHEDACRKTHTDWSV